MPVTMSALSMGMLATLINAARVRRRMPWSAMHVISPTTVAIVAANNPIDNVFDSASKISSLSSNDAYQSSVKPVQCPRYRLALND